ncbi:hypothetical protein Tco_1085153 [Tanacetum coccineum]
MIHLSQEVFDLEKEKDAQAVEILNLKKRVKKLERHRKSSISSSRRRTYSNFDDIDDYTDNIVEETFDAATTGVSTASAPVTTIGVTISTAIPRTPPIITTVFDDEDVTMAMAQTLIKMKEQKAKKKRVSITDVEDVSKPLQVQSDAEIAQLLHQEELAELGRRERERTEQEEASIAALYDKYDDNQASIDVDALFAAKLQQEEREQFTIEKEQNSCQLKENTYEEIHGLYERQQKRIQDFIPMDSEKEVVKESGKKDDSSSKSARSTRRKTLEQESAEYDEEIAADYEQEKEELRMWLTVIPDEEETMDPDILSTKYPIVYWESQHLGSSDMEDLHVYKIIKADGNTSYHKSLSSMLKRFDRQDLGDLKIMFEPNAEDEVWSNQPDWTLISWKLYENCGVHSLLMDGTLICFNMLVEKKYPLIKGTLQKMLNWRLEAEAESIMAFELLKFVKS